MSKITSSLCPIHLAKYLKDSPIIDTDVSVTLGEHSKRTDNPRRVNRLNEREEEHIERALPETSRRLVMGDNWMKEIIEHPDLVWRRADFRRNVIEIALGHLHWIDWVTATCTPGNAWIKETTGCSRWELFAARRWLKAHGFLAQVHNGRSAKYTPASSDGFSHLISADRVPLSKMADRAVYVLCLPMSPEELTAALEAERERKETRCKLVPFLDRLAAAVDINLHPNQPERKTSPKRNYEWASPTRKEYWEAVARVTAERDAARTDLSWDRHATTSAPDEATRDFNELQAAMAVRWDTPALQNMSTRYVRRLLAPAFRAGYTVSDIKHLLSFKPDGTKYPHDAFTGVKNVPAALNAKLQAWKINGQFVYSYDQREAKRSAPLVERAIASAAKPPVVATVETDGKRAGFIAMLRNAIKPKSS